LIADTANAARKVQREHGATELQRGFCYKDEQNSLCRTWNKEGQMITVQQITQTAGTGIPLDKHFFKNILLATDFSPASKKALEYAASLARRYGSAIYLTHVITRDGYPLVSPEYTAFSLEKMYAETKEGFREILKSEQMIDLPYKILIQEGNLWPSIEGLIKTYNIDLLVVGTRGVGAVEKVLIGSGAEEMFRKARVPVLTVGPSVAKEPLYEMEFKNILLATDFGGSAEREAEYALSLAQKHCSRLRLVHVLPHPEAYGKDVMAMKKENSIAQLRELVPIEMNLHCKLDFEVAVGEPVEQILRIAEETKADLIIMGAKARSSLAGNVPHTKAYRVVCGARCPVLTVRS
jgi:nucleotide-binding universal stress UspA family protein